MAKFKLDDYNFIEDVSQLNEMELENAIKDTKTVLDALKKKMTKANVILPLAAGLLEIRGGSLDKVTLFGAKYKKGDASKEELKIVKKVISTYKKYLLFKVIIALIADKQAGMKYYDSCLAIRKK